MTKGATGATDATDATGATGATQGESVAEWQESGTPSVGGATPASHGKDRELEV